MEHIDVSTVMAIVANLVGLGAIYGGIRSDIKAMCESIKENKTDIESVNRRVDDILKSRWR